MGKKGFSLGFSKTKDKTEKTGSENLQQDKTSLPIVPDDWMRMYGQLADLIGFGQSFRGGTVNDMYKQGIDRSPQGNLGPPSETGGSFENMGNLPELGMGITQEQVNLFREAGIPENEIFSLIPELTTDEQYNNYGEGMLFRDEEGIKTKPRADTSASIPQSNVNSGYDYAQDFADMDANQLEASQRLARLRAMSSVGR